ncbi:ParD-like family protein [Alcanivorax sp. 1008]|uniref:ParD-like family protein n=1 Tax=Alcanivorax sp. 1008 TaxID=2816853 RepID=UPI001DFD1929|nr:ParD-like family protein [Alcanivorax sp. 1008]MCC1497938.1 hypothetical protein [Alcanivorax sp. 1008]
MAKANSPVRLDAELMEEAARHGRLFHRSTAETIEYWASLGRRFQKLIDPDVLLEIQAGSMVLDVKPAQVGHIAPESVLSQLEANRVARDDNQLVNREKPIYQASESHPGMLEQILPDGTVTVGQFFEGRFFPAKE